MRKKRQRRRTLDQFHDGNGDAEKNLRTFVNEGVPDANHELEGHRGKDGHEPLAEKE